MVEPWKVHHPKVRTSERKLARSPNVTGRLIYPSGYAYAPRIMPWKGELTERSSDRGMHMASRVSM